MVTLIRNDMHYSTSNMWRTESWVTIYWM